MLDGATVALLLVVACAVGAAVALLVVACDVGAAVTLLVVI